MRRIVLALLVVAAVGHLAAPQAQSRRFIAETDLYRFTWIADPQISPDGSTVAFVRVTVNEKENRYETSVFTVAAAGGEEPKRLTSGVRDTSPRWAPDGTRLAFVRSIDRDEKTQPSQVYLLRVDGGEARPLTNVASGASSPVWSPDGRTIAFNSETSVHDGKTSDDPKPAADRKSDVTVVTKAVYRANGNPRYVDTEHHTHIFTIDASEPSEQLRPGSEHGRNELQTQITDGDYDERGMRWSPDGLTLFFTSTRVPEPYVTDTGDSLYRVPAAGGAIAKVTSIDGSVGTLSVSPDGRQIAFVGALRGTPIRSYSQPDLWVTDAAPGSTPKNLTVDYDFDIAGGISGDQGSPRGENRRPIVWSSDGASLIVVSAERGSSHLKRVSIATGRVTPITDGARDIVAFSATSRASRIAAIVSTQTNIGDIAVLDVPGAEVARTTLASMNPITHVNADLFRSIQQSEPEELWYRAFDGKQIQGWILKPPDFDASKKYPLILEIHGGPHSAYGNAYTHEFQWMAAKGYVVLFTNPRGSTSYGQEFGNIIQYHYPGDDYKDLMAGVDEVVKRGYVDADRLGVTGGSGGGLLTNWTITQTQRFKAAVAQRDIADWYGFWFTADFTLFQPTWFRKAPWEDPQDFAARSPITHVANVTTPLMLVNGDADYRTPPADGGEMMFRALKYRKIPTVMVRFPRETHELSRSGEPWHRVERLQHIVGWMDQWLMGKKNAAYGTQ
jgi:dipeptidyl aminopeptidase/acylaminoacyl peptidase